MEVGDYVRLNDGYIGKYHIEKENVIEYRWQGGCDRAEKDVLYIGERLYFNVRDKIIKSSPDILDLIGVDDYVNGAKVVKIKTDENGVKWVYTNNENAYGYKLDEIKSIVTHEQFESIEYKVGEQ